MSAPAPDRDARILSRLRAWWADNAAKVAAIPGYRVPVEVDEFEVLLRQADENSELRRALCDEREGRGRRPLTEPDPAYIIRTCRECGHAPHGRGLLCGDSKQCGCRADAGVTS